MDIGQLILEFVILILLGYVAFFKSYFAEKGKNIATQEDIESITTLVENVKMQLQFQTETKLNLTFEKKTTILNLFDAINQWEITVLDININQYGDQEYQRPNIEDISIMFKNKETDFFHSYSRFHLFIQSEELTKHIEVIRSKIREVQNRTIQYLENYKELLSTMYYNRIVIGGDYEMFKKSESEGEVLKIKFNEFQKTAYDELAVLNLGLRNELNKFLNTLMT